MICAFFVCCIDVLVKLHYIFSSSSGSSKGDSEDYTKRRSGFDICPFSVCTTTRSPEEFGIIFILGCVCVVYTKRRFWI